MARSVNMQAIIGKVAVWGHRQALLLARVALVPMTWLKLKPTLLESRDGFQPKAICAHKSPDA